MNTAYLVKNSSSHPTMVFAAEELRRCLDLLPAQSGQGCIELRVEPVEGLHPFDDLLSIHVTDGTGVIAGPNERSVLLGVYRYLRELGCRFLFPGKDGELFPETVSLAGSRVELEDRPANRYRGICIEGGNRLEILLDMIDFLPKLGFNSYFIQFRQAFVFFRRWYRHTSHPHLEDKTPYPVEEAEANMAKAVEEIARRGLVYHAVGHGWTCDPFGVPGLEWDPWTGEVPEEAKQYFALVNGKRELWNGVPLNTSVCFSNPACRKIMVDAVVDYAKTHPDSDVIHLWLSDGRNNHCECPECQKKIPADWYLILLNEIDAALTAEGIDARICFLIYCELLWPPVEETFRNPDRFVLMFAPISRTYRTTFASDEAGEMAPYVRNQIEMPTRVADNLAHLRAWQKLFTGDGFLFDYHYMWAHHRDAGGYAIARVLYDDLQNLQKLGLNGLMSCQVQRAMFPNALGITVMAEALWHGGRKSFEAITEDYMQSLYGSYAEKISSYLQELSALTSALDLEHPEQLSEEKAKIADRIAFRTSVLLQVTPLNAVSPLPTAGRFLYLHARLWHRLAEALAHLHRREFEQAQAAWQYARELLWETEPQTEMGLDCYNFDRTFGGTINRTVLAFA